jgi:hypothetical protein
LTEIPFGEYSDLKILLTAVRHVFIFGYRFVISLKNKSQDVQTRDTRIKSLSSSVITVLVKDDSMSTDGGGVLTKMKCPNIEIIEQHSLALAQMIKVYWSECLIF